MLKNFNLILFFYLFIIGCSDKPSPQKADDFTQEKPKNIISNDEVSLNNQGVGEMGYFDYDKASLTFKKLVELQPDWSLAQQNLAIALLNRQKQGDEDKSIEIANQLLSKNPNNAVAHYILGILSFNQGLCEKALPHFEKVISIDENDAYAYYFKGQCHLQNAEIDKAMIYYQKAIEEDSYLRSAYYGAFMVAQRLGETKTAESMLNAYQKLEANPQAKLAEIKYTRMGPKAIAMPHQQNKVSKRTKEFSPPFFKSPEITNISLEQTKNFGVSNFTQDNSPYFFTQSNREIKWYKRDIGNNYIKIQNLQIKTNSTSSKIAWGDINNDGHIDAYISGLPDQIFFGNETEFSLNNNNLHQMSQSNSQSIRLIDTDHDGDLDILTVSEDGEFEIWNNNLDGSFRPLSKEMEWIKAKNFQSIFVQDIDKDRDVDILLLSDENITILLNDRMWKYQFITFPINKKVKTLIFADNNLNGFPEVGLVTDHSIEFHEFNISINNLNKLSEIKLPKSKSVIAADFNGDGLKEFLAQSSDSLKLISTTGKILEEILIKNTTGLKLLSTLNGPEILVQKNQQLFHIKASKNRGAYLLLSFTGKEDDANSVRSNFSGVGANFTVHSKGFYTSSDSYYNDDGLSQSYQPINIAAGASDHIDYLEIEWSDGVYQTELNLPTSQYFKIEETQRQLSSCPVIFAWNNGQYEFLSDVLGVGGIGFAIGKDQYGVPRPWENYLVKSDQLSSEDGYFKFQFTEPMEESAYLDELKLEVIDIPENLNVILDERMVINQPIASGEPLYYSELIYPSHAQNILNQDVTTQILKKDKIAPELINSEHRFLGIIDEQIISLEFDQQLLGRYQLIMNGWVEYGYSQTMFAAWQAGLSAQAPTVEALIDDQWVPLLIEFGYPAGMPRESSVPINIPKATQNLRVRSNMELYFDQLALIQPVNVDLVKNYSLALEVANLHQLGFPKRSDNHQRVPTYDFTKTSPFWDTRYMEGAYTQLGDVLPLVNKKDNALAIIGAGEAIELSFADTLPELEDNYQRYFILKFKGWAKDMDIMTKDGETLDPMPFEGEINQSAKDLNLRFNTRFKAGR